MRRRQEHRADLGKQPFWRWLFMAEMKGRTKRWFTWHICTVSCKFFQHHPKVRDKELSFTPITLIVSEVVRVILKHSGEGNQTLAWLLTSHQRKNLPCISYCDNEFYIFILHIYHLADSLTYGVCQRGRGLSAFSGEIRKHYIFYLDQTSGHPVPRL